MATSQAGLAVHRLTPPSKSIAVRTERSCLDRSAVLRQHRLRRSSLTFFTCGCGSRATNNRISCYLFQHRSCSEAAKNWSRRLIRHGGKKAKARNVFLGWNDFRQCTVTFRSNWRIGAFPVTIYYAFKQSDTDESDDATSNSGWADIHICGDSIGLCNRLELGPCVQRSKGIECIGNQEQTALSLFHHPSVSQT